MDTDFKRAVLGSNWSSICRSTEAHLEGMSGNWCREAYQAVAEKLGQFVSLPAPKSDAELQERFPQDMGLSSIIACVSHIESMLGGYAQRGQDRLRLVNAICSTKLPVNGDDANKLYAARMAILMQVASISADETMMGIRRPSERSIDGDGGQTNQ